MFVEVFEKTFHCRCRYVNLVGRDESRRKSEQRAAEEGEVSQCHGEWRTGLSHAQHRLGDSERKDPGHKWIISHL